MSSRRTLYALGEPIGDSCTRLEAGRLVLGDGGSSQSSSSTSTTNVDKRQVVDNGAVGVSSDSSTVNVTMTDDGAVNKAIDLVANAGKGALDAYKSLLAATLALEGKNADTLKANTDLAAQLVATSDTSTLKIDDNMKKILTYGGLAIAGFIALKK